MVAARRLGHRLQRLVDVIRPEGRQRHTDTEIAAYVGVSPGYISKLRKGASVPTAHRALRLAEFFDLPVEYLLRGDEHPAVVEVERRLRALEAARGGAVVPAADAGGSDEADVESLMRKLRDNHRVQQIAMRAERLTPDGQAAVLSIVDQILSASDAASPGGEPAPDR